MGKLQTNGTVVYEKNGFEQIYLDRLNRLFKNKIPVDKNDDLLCANMIVTENNIVGSSKIKNKMKYRISITLTTHLMEEEEHTNVVQILLI